MGIENGMKIRRPNGLGRERGTRRRGASRAGDSGTKSAIKVGLPRNVLEQSGIMVGLSVVSSLGLLDKFRGYGEGNHRSDGSGRGIRKEGVLFLDNNSFGEKRRESL